METSYLASFMLVIETGSMAQAARRLNITAAAVAQQIKALEREFKAPLLTRAGRAMVPTLAGHRLSQSAPVLLRELANARTHVHDEGTAGELVLGTINTALHSLLPDILSGFVRKCPDVKVFLRSATTAELYDAVSQGDVDAAVCLHPSFALAKTFNWTLLREEPLVLLAPRRLAERDPHELLQTQPLILYDRQLGGGKMVLKNGQTRLMLNGEKPWQVGIISMTLMLTCGGRVAIQ